MREGALARSAATVLWLGDAACHDASLVGGKAANLSRLVARFHVPAGFCLLANGRAPAALSSGGPLEDAYAQLSERCGSEAPSVAVRSSAVDEDGARGRLISACLTRRNTRRPVSGHSHLDRLLLVPGRGDVAERRVSASRIVGALDVLEDPTAAAFWPSSLSA